MSKRRIGYFTAGEYAGPPDDGRDELAGLFGDDDGGGGGFDFSGSVSDAAGFVNDIAHTAAPIVKAATTAYGVGSALVNAAKGGGGGATGAVSVSTPGADLAALYAGIMGKVASDISRPPPPPIKPPAPKPAPMPKLQPKIKFQILKKPIEPLLRRQVESIDMAGRVATPAKSPMPWILGGVAAAAVAGGGLWFAHSRGVL